MIICEGWPPALTESSTAMRQLPRHSANEGGGSSRPPQHSFDSMADAHSWPPLISRGMCGRLGWPGNAGQLRWPWESDRGDVAERTTAMLRKRARHGPQLRTGLFLLEDIDQLTDLLARDRRRHKKAACQTHTVARNASMRDKSQSQIRDKLTSRLLRKAFHHMLCKGGEVTILPPPIPAL